MTMTRSCPATLRACTFLALTFLGAGSRADIVHLVNGNRLEGTASDAGSKVKLVERYGVGEIYISTTKVHSIEYGAWLTESTVGVRNVSYLILGATNAVSQSETEKWLKDVSSLRLPPAVKTYVPDVTRGWSGQSTRDRVLIVVGVIGLAGFVIWSLVSVVVSIIILVDAFKLSVAWGLFLIFLSPLSPSLYLLLYYSGNQQRMYYCLVSPLPTLLYLFTYYSGNRRRMFSYLISPLIWLLIVGATLAVMGRVWPVT